MPRLRRTTSAGLVHVFARGDQGMRLFHDAVDRHDFTTRLALVADERGWTVVAASLLGNHFHLVLRVPADSLSEGMHDLLSGFANWWRRRHGHRGHVFGSRFGSRLVADEAYERFVILYVVCNPVRAGLVDRWDAWPWTSYDRAYVARVYGSVAAFQRVVAAYVQGDATDDGRPTLAALLRDGEAGVVRAHRVHGYSLREIASALGAGLGTVHRLVASRRGG